MSALYTTYKKTMMDGAAPNLGTVNLKIVLVDAADYTIDLVNHDFLDDVPAGGRVATSGNLAGKTTTGAVFDATNMTPAFTAATGDPSEYIILYQDTGTVSTSRLLVLWDAGTGLPVTPNGGDINVSWTTTIFSL